MNTAQEIRFDARELEHPKPLEEAVWHLRRLETGQYLHMIHRRCPYPLLEICDKNGYRYAVREIRTDLWHLFFTKDENLPLDELAREAGDV